MHHAIAFVLRKWVRAFELKEHERFAAQRAVPHPTYPGKF